MITKFIVLKNYFYLKLYMPPKKVVKEPDVVIPNGDPAAGRGIFDAVLIIFDKFSNVQHAML